MKRFFAFCLVLAIIMAGMVFPTGALAAAYGKGVNVFGVNVNNGPAVTYWKVYKESKWNTYTLTSTGASASDYDVMYDRESQTLTLCNVNAPNAAANSGNTSFISMDQTQYMNEKYTINIVLVGTNTIGKPGYSIGSGIRANDGISVVLQGTGSLTITDVGRGISASGDKGGSITINSGTIDITAKDDCALYSSDGNIYIHGGNVSLKVIMHDKYSTNSISAISAGDNDAALISVKNAVLRVYSERGGSTNLFRVWNSGRNGATRSIVIENSDVLAQINGTYGHAAVFSVKPTVIGGTPYISDNYDGTDAVVWDGSSDIGYDNTSFSGGGKGNRYFSLVPSYTVTVGVNPADSGTASGSGTFSRDATATVVATPFSNYKFVNWTEGGSVVSTDATYSFQVNSNRSLIANFVETYTVSYVDGVEGEEIFADVVVGNLLAGDPTPAFGADPQRDGYTFEGWSPAVQDTVTVTQVYTATWEAIPVDVPQTGDSNHLYLCLAALAISGAGIVLLFKRKYS